MRIQSVIWSLGLGGHAKSALAHAKYLKEMGHDCYFLARPGRSREMEQELADARIPVRFFHKPLREYSLLGCGGATEIEAACRDNNVDVILAHDAAHLAASYRVAVKLRKGMVFCLAGGPSIHLALPKNMPLVFYSQELLDEMPQQCRLNRDSISVIRARIDTSTYKPGPVDTSFTERYALPQAGKKIVAAVRFSMDKSSLLKSLLAFAAEVGGRTADVHLVIAGDGSLFEAISARAAEINGQYNRRVVQLTGPILNPKDLTQLYNYADIVAGSGRGILEAMACGKCVVNLGENGEASVVDPQNVEQIAQYNFSGRHFRYAEGDQDGIHGCLSDILADEARQESAGRFSLQYIQEHMDARIGARELAAVLAKAADCRHRYRDYCAWYLRAIAVRLLRGQRLRFHKRLARRREFLI